jgi:hypothetical protein
MEQKGEQLAHAKGQARLALFDLSIHLLGQLPESMGLGQSLGVLNLAAAGQVRRGWTGQLGLRGHLEQEPGQGRQQQVSGPVGKGPDPFPDCFRGWTGFWQLVHQPAEAQTDDEIQPDHPLQQRKHVMTVGVQKVRQQTMGAPTQPAADPLNAQAVSFRFGAGPAVVSAPADQTVRRLTVRVGTALGQFEGTTWTGSRLGVLFDGKGKMDYDDHACMETPSHVDERSTLSQRGGVFLSGE